MTVDLHGSLRLWVFLVVLVALFSAALFRPERILQPIRLWIAAGLLAFILLLECVAPLFFSPSLGTSLSAGGASKWSSLASEMQVYLNAVKVIGVFQHGALAAAVLVALSTFFDRATFSWERPPRKSEAGAQPRTEAVQEPLRRQTAEDACLSCGQRIPPDASECPACGWTWSNEKTGSG